MFGISELAIILIVAVLVLGAKKLPELARSAGKSARILKAEAKAMKETQGSDGEARGPRVIRGETVDRQGFDGSKQDTGRPPGGA
ncbi:twin-arginine translocase TatA/TatE family subunit [Streptomyces sp. NPDC057963]|uniref:twin-arginine translocase TatA/TatE family subunit n=1 Tax=Streptomyces sp. NPDC057963 TaxID=3346290 RepID=UPI0036E2768C